MTDTVSPRAAELKELADELSPARMLARLGERARFTVSSVSVVGSALTALGVISAARLALPGAARALVIAAVLVAVVAVLCALSYLTLRPRQINRHNLAEVEAWRNQELARMGLVVWSGRLLLLAVVLASGAAAVVMLAGGPVAAVTVQMLRSGEPTVTVEATVSGAEPGERFSVQLVDAADDAGSPLLVAAMVADATGAATTSATVRRAADLDVASASVSHAGGVLVTAEVQLAAGSADR